MNRNARISLVCTLALIGFLGCSKPAPPDNAAKVEETIQTLQGRWETLVLNRAGKRTADSGLKDIEVNIRKDLYSLWESRSKGPGTTGELFVDEFIIQLNPAELSREIDLAYSKGDKQGMVHRGIYALDGTELKLCYGEVGGPRPTEFAATEKPATTLVVLRRRQ